MKFGGTSVATAERIVGAAEVVRSRLERHPTVVVSALAGVTDLLENLIGTALAGDLEALEPQLAELERRHRWAVAGAIEDPGARHDLNLEVDRLFEELRQLLRSVRVLGELTPRARDALLGFGENLSSRIVAAVFRERGLPARWMDARELIVTDGRHGAARANLESVRERVEARLRPAIDRGEVPVIGGFIGATADGVPTTLGRGGSDTSAAVLGSALDAEEIQIWTDVDGLMSADPRLVPSARTLARVSFGEAAELTFHGARVLHPEAVAPAVERGIPVRVLNSMRPGCAGTVIVGEADRGASPLAGVASRSGLHAVRITSPRLRLDPQLCSRALAALSQLALDAELVLASAISVTIVLGSAPDPTELASRLGDARVEAVGEGGCGVVCLVGAGLADDAALRREALVALSSITPDLVSIGGSSNSVVAVLAQSRLQAAVAGVHERFFGAMAGGS